MALAIAAPNVSNDTIQEYQRAYSTQKRRCDEENGVLRSLLKKAKSDGVNTKILIEVHQTAKQEHDVILAEMRARVRYMALRSIPVHSVDLFDDIDLDVSESSQMANERHTAETAGYAHGQMGGSLDENPYSGESDDLAGHWRTGHAEGVAARKRTEIRGEQTVPPTPRPGRRGGRRRSTAH